MENISIDENIAYHKELVSLYGQEKKAILDRIKHLENLSIRTHDKHPTEINLEKIGLKQRLLDVEQSIKTQDNWLKELKERKQLEKEVEKDAKKDKKEAKVINIRGDKYQ